MSINMIIGADIVPTESNYGLFRTGNRKELIGEELCNLLDRVDYMILNLEVPLVDTESPITKCGPNLIAQTDMIAGLKAINPYFYTLANNHILDQGSLGLKSTMDVFEKSGIAYAGVGNNLAEASKPFIAEIKGIKIGIYCCAEHEFSIATESKAGANPYDPLYSFDHVRDLKKNSDVVIVLYHGGKEEYRYPSPELQRIFRKFAEVGADYVIAQHTHCIGCVEEYHGSTLVYGQGNFLFDLSESEYWQTSMLLELIIDKENHSCSYIPIVKCGEKVRLPKKMEADEIMGELRSRSEQILMPGFIQKEYQAFAEGHLQKYLLAVHGKRSFLKRVINKISMGKFYKLLIKKQYNKNSLVAIQNYIECEAHRELFLSGIKSVR